MPARLLFTNQYGDLQGEAIPESGVLIYGHQNGEHPLQPGEVGEPPARCRIYFDGESWRLQNIGAPGLTRLHGEVVVAEVGLPDRALIHCSGQQLKFESSLRRARAAGRVTPPDVQRTKEPEAARQPSVPPTPVSTPPAAHTPTSQIEQTPADAQRIEQLQRENALLQARITTLIGERDRMRQELEDLAAEVALLKGAGPPRA